MKEYLAIELGYVGYVHSDTDILDACEEVATADNRYRKGASCS